MSPTEQLRRVEQELQRFPSSVLEEFHRATGHVRPALTTGDLGVWALQGAEIARQSVRSWESALEYFRASPQVLRHLSFSHSVTWAQWGLTLSQDSPTIATAYFRATPGVLGRLSPQAVFQWADTGRALFKGTWKSSALSSRYFEASPELLQHLSLRDFRRFVDFVAVLSHKSYDLAMECLTLAPQVLARLEGHHQSFISLASAVAERNWREVRPYFECSGVVLPRVERSQRGRYLVLTEALVRDGMGSVAAYLQETSAALAELDSREHGHVLTLAESLQTYASDAVPEFMKTLPQVVGRVSVERLEAWFQEGTTLLRENPEGGKAYFRLETSRAERVLERLSSGVELERIKDVMRLYCRALTGTKVELRPTQELVHRGVGWAAEGKPTTEGTHVYLPEVIDRFSDKDGNFQWYKVMTTHQVAHLEFPSFNFEYGRPSLRFADLRPLLAAGRPPSARRLPGAGLEKEPQADGASAERAWLTDLEQFFDLFGDRRLALDVFTVLEDGRVDSRVLREYRGIRSRYTEVQRDALAARPEIESLPAREAMVEFLVRLSLQQYRGLPVPAEYVEEARKIARVARRLLHAEAGVEDTAEATLRVYSLIAQLPNERVPEDDWQSMDAEGSDEDDQDLSQEELEQLMQQLQGELQQQDQEGEGEQQYQPSQEVEYRGDFKPELTQLLAQLKMERQQAARGEAPNISKEMLEELLKKSVEMDAQEGEVAQGAGMYANNILRETGVHLQQQPDFGYGPISHVDEDGGPLEAMEPRTHVYHEWDFRADDYKPRWCLVRERLLAESDSRFYGETLASYAGLVSQIKREFELVVPEMLRKEKRLRDGDDLDMDAVMEAMADRRSGITPSEKIYWRRNKVQRDVAVAFLMDMSASTAEAIDETRRMADDWDAPDDPVEYMIWLRTRRGEGQRRSYKRIIDLEKESIVLLIQALETIGDVYGIYGFSGYGRENVEFYVIKDIEEQFSERVKRRIDKVSPLHATRMGPAIRHATSKLERQDARTKFLFLISDGRPQDRGYSREGVEKEYAVHDTRMALVEAKRKNVVPFCLTVDKQGHDYLKTMCQDMGYEILWDIHSLPQRLPRLYRRLTV